MIRESTHIRTGRWADVTRQSPCPACGKTKWCGWSPDRKLLRCRGTDTNAPAGMQKVPSPSGDAMLYAVDGADAGPIPKPATTPKTAAKVYATAALAVATYERRLGPGSDAWTYHDAAGKPMGRVVRFRSADGAKEDRPVSRVPGGWVCRGMAQPHPLYDLHKLAQTDIVVVGEGEKTAEAIKAIGYTGTTSPNGCKSAGKADWSPLSGKDVVILPDHDDGGEHYADHVARLLGKLNPPARVRVVRLAEHYPELPRGGDLADVLAPRNGEGRDPADVRAVIDKATQAAATVQPAEPMPSRAAVRKPTATPKLIRMSDVEPTDVAWLWPGRIPLGRMTLLVGRPGLGKSFLTAYLAATVSRGRAWIDGSACYLPGPGSVVLVSAEDDPADTIAPRLIAQDADRERVHLLAGVTERNEQDEESERVFTLADVSALRDTLDAVKDCRLIIVDPIGSYLGGKADAHRDNEVRGVLAPACKLAAEHNAALVVVAHNRKSAAAHADDTAMGSRAFTGLARSVLHLLEDPDDDTEKRRLLLPGKNNLAERPAGLAFDIGPGAFIDPTTGEGRACVRWHDGEVDLTADEVVSRVPEKKDGKQSGFDEAKAWLTQALAAGSRPMKDLIEEARGAEGISLRTLERAKKELGVKSDRPVVPGPWWWRMPGTDTPCGAHRQPLKDENVAALAVLAEDPENAVSSPKPRVTPQHRHTANPLENERPSPERKRVRL